MTAYKSYQIYLIEVFGLMETWWVGKCGLPGQISSGSVGADIDSEHVNHELLCDLSSSDQI